MTHKGHRERLKNRFLSSPESFEDHELLELILFYTIPRKNTNETAHRLISRFGSLKGVLNASIEALCEVEDIGPNSALYIKAIAVLLMRYETSEAKDDGVLKSQANLVAFLKNLFIGTQNEISYILLFDNSKRLITCEKIGEGFSLEHTLSLRKITSCALSSNAVSAILVHNHPNGRAFPTGDDIHATNRIRLVLEPLGVTLMEHFIVAENECMPIINSQNAYRFSGKDH